MIFAYSQFTTLRPMSQQTSAYTDEHSFKTEATEKSKSLDGTEMFIRFLSGVSRSEYLGRVFVCVPDPRVES